VILRVGLLIENGQLDEARMELATDPVSAGPLPSFLARDLSLLRFRVAVLVGDPASAETQIGVLELTGNRLEAELVRAMHSIVQGDSAATLEAINTAIARQGTHPVLAAAGAAFRTVLLARSGDRLAAEASLVDTLSRSSPQKTLHALTAAGREPVFLGLLRDHLAGPNAHPFATIALDALDGYGADWSSAGGMTLLARTRPDAHAAPPRRLDAVVNNARIRLTPREADVLDQLALGSSYVEIAKALFITENTAKTHLTSLYRKLGVDNRSAALRTARAVEFL
jgi:DNA-binding CsgD family transcriptional regulator